jgi:hypothetical protein
MNEELVIAETISGNWHYHLRRVGSSGLKLGGGLSLLGKEGRSLCGKELAWDTKFSLTAWGKHDGYSHWCSACETIAKGAK